MSHAEQVSRYLRYYDYLVAARRDKMSHYLNAIKQKKMLEQQVLNALQELKAVQLLSEQEQVALVQLRDERKQLLASLDSDLKDKDAELKQLERDRESLQKVIDQIEKQRALAITLEKERLLQEEKIAQEKERRETEQRNKVLDNAAKPVEPPIVAEPLSPVNAATPTSRDESIYSAEDLARLQATAFSKRKGKLPWPVKGSIANRFGEQRQGSVTWEGFRIRAQAGAEVHAVHYGRVVYAEWLRGQGMLVILDHGDGFMSLYAHNDVLLRSAGEWVQAGDTIARVGNSGGEKESGLYFEIRQNGQTVDPAAWLSRK